MIMIVNDVIYNLYFLILGELIIRLPQEASHVFVEGRPFRLSIEYSLENPQGGLHFYVPKDPSTCEVFVFTF